MLDMLHVLIQRRPLLLNKALDKVLALLQMSNTLPQGKSALKSLVFSVPRGQRWIVMIQGLVSALHHSLQWLLTLAVHTVEALIDEAPDLVPPPHGSTLRSVLPLLGVEVTV